MGELSGGSTSGQIPFNRALAVAYPGLIANPEKAIATLGGLETIAEARSKGGRENFLELRFRPSDPYSHPLYGDHQETGNLLLRVSHKRKKKTQKTANDPAHRQRLSGEEDTLGLRTPAQASEASGVEPAGGPDLKSASDAPAAHAEAAREGLAAECSPSGAAEEAGKVVVEVVARVESTYRFQGLADFQWVPALHVREPTDEDGWNGPGRKMEEDEPLVLVPPIFCRNDIPQDHVLRSEGETQRRASHKKGAKRKAAAAYLTQHRAIVAAARAATSLAPLNPGEEQDQPEESLALVPAAVKQPAVPPPPLRSPSHCALDFRTADTPTADEATLAEDEAHMTSDERRALTALRSVFASRPVWSKSSLLAEVPDLRAPLVRRLLFLVAYYFGNGPFRALWIRLGYDPRQLSASRALQILDFRFPPGWKAAWFRRNATRPTAEPPPSWQDVNAFRALPLKRTTFLQLVDLDDDTIRALAAAPAELTQCDEYTGWYTKETMEKLRWRVRDRFHEVLTDKIGVDVVDSRIRVRRPARLRDGEPESEEREDAREEAIEHEERLERLLGIVCEEEMGGVGGGEGMDERTFEGAKEGEEAGGGNEDGDEIDGEDEDEGDLDIGEDDDDEMEGGEEDEEDEEEEDEEEEEEEEEEEGDEEEGGEGRVVGVGMDPRQAIPEGYLHALLGSFGVGNVGEDVSDGGGANGIGEYEIFEEEDESSDD